MKAIDAGLEVVEPAVHLVEPVVHLACSVCPNQPVGRTTNRRAGPTASRPSGRKRPCDGESLAFSHA